MKRDDFEIVRSFEDKLFLALRVDYFDEVEAIEEEPEVEIPIPEPVIIEPEESIAEIIDEEPIEPKAEEIAKLKEQLANLQNVVKDIEEGE